LWHSNYTANEEWIRNNQDKLAEWRQVVEQLANQADPQEASTRAFLVPGTPEFQQEFDRITSLEINRRRYQILR
jgi:CHASE3 domain sensor protein